MDKIQIPIYRGLTENDSQYYGLLLFWTQNDISKVSAITEFLYYEVPPPPLPHPTSR